MVDCKWAGYEKLTACASIHVGDVNGGCVRQVEVAGWVDVQFGTDVEGTLNKVLVLVLVLIYSTLNSVYGSLKRETDSGIFFSDCWTNPVFAKTHPGLFWDVWEEHIC